MRQAIRLLKGSALQIYRDQMLLLLCIAPFLTGTVMCLVIPLADRLLVKYANFTITPYYLMSDALVMTLGSMMSGIMVGLLMLDERDDGICAYYAVTPIGGVAYLVSRLALPFIYSLFSALIVIAYSALGGMDYVLLLAPAVLSACSGPVMAMLLVSIASNKVEGLAVSKLIGIIIFGIPIAWFADSWLRVIGYLLPSFWPMDMLLQAKAGDMAGYVLDFAIGLACICMWIAGLYGMFSRKMG